LFVLATNHSLGPKQTCKRQA